MIINGVSSPFRLQPTPSPPGASKADNAASKNVQTQADLQSAVALAGLDPTTIIFGSRYLFGGMNVSNTASLPGFNFPGFNSSFSPNLFSGLTNTLNSPNPLTIQQVLQAGLSIQRNPFASASGNSFFDPGSVDFSALPNPLTQSLSQLQPQTANLTGGRLRNGVKVKLKSPNPREQQTINPGVGNKKAAEPQFFAEPQPLTPAIPTNEQAAIRVLLQYRDLLDSMADGISNGEFSTSSLRRIADDVNSAYPAELKAAAAQLVNDKTLTATLRQSGDGIIRFEDLRTLL